MKGKDLDEGGDIQDHSKSYVALLIGIYDLLVCIVQVEQV